MKNIADVNSDDILTELNNLDYAEDDLQLLDDEDIRPISNKPVEEDFSNLYRDYNASSQKLTNKNSKIDLFTEKPVNSNRNLDRYIEKANKLVEQPRNKDAEISKKDSVQVDDYLNRTVKSNTNNVKNNFQTYSSSKASYTSSKPVSTPSITGMEHKNLSNPLINKANLQKAQNNLNMSPSKVEINDLNQLFNKVSNNVKGASEIVNRNTEIKKKIDERFEELRRVQQEHEENKKKDYAEINAYKDEVYSKIQQKKTDMERDLIALREGQEKLESERNSFEAYKKNALAELKKLEKELKDSYDARNKNIEQVELGLVKRKEQLDKERDSIQKDREELANNLLQFNKLVDDFTQGIDNFE